MWNIRGLQGVYKRTQLELRPVGFWGFSIKGSRFRISGFEGFNGLGVWGFGFRV